MADRKMNWATCVVVFGSAADETCAWAPNDIDVMANGPLSPEQREECYSVYRQVHGRRAMAGLKLDITEVMGEDFKIGYWCEAKKPKFVVVAGAHLVHVDLVQATTLSAALRYHRDMSGVNRASVNLCGFPVRRYTEDEGGLSAIRNRYGETMTWSTFDTRKTLAGALMARNRRRWFGGAAEGDLLELVRFMAEHPEWWPTDLSDSSLVLSRDTIVGDKASRRIIQVVEEAKRAFYHNTQAHYVRLSKED
jgi:hypothetical protein